MHMRRSSLSGHREERHSHRGIRCPPRAPVVGVHNLTNLAQNYPSDNSESEQVAQLRKQISSLLASLDSACSIRDHLQQQVDDQAKEREFFFQDARASEAKLTLQLANALRERDEAEYQLKDLMKEYSHLWNTARDRGVLIASLQNKSSEGVSYGRGIRNSRGEDASVLSLDSANTPPSHHNALLTTAKHASQENDFSHEMITPNVCSRNGEQLPHLGEEKYECLSNFLLNTSDGEHFSNGLSIPIATRRVDCNKKEEILHRLLPTSFGGSSCASSLHTPKRIVRPSAPGLGTPHIFHNNRRFR